VSPWSIPVTPSSCFTRATEPKAFASAATVEALAAAHRLGTAIAVSRNDVGPSLRAAAEADGVAFHIV
jgi:hypothetical protein